MLHITPTWEPNATIVATSSAVTVALASASSTGTDQVAPSSVEYCVNTLRGSDAAGGAGSAPVPIVQAAHSAPVDDRSMLSDSIS